MKAYDYIVKATCFHASLYPFYKWKVPRVELGLRRTHLSLAIAVDFKPASLYVNYTSGEIYSIICRYKSKRCVIKFGIH